MASADSPESGNDEEKLAFQRAYMVPGEDDGETATEQFLKKKRKMIEEAREKPVKKQKQKGPNTAVYVTSLPLDVTVDELYERFSKFGLIAEEIESNRPRITLYKDKDGNNKGDALIVYFRPESISNAILVLDETDFRWGEKGPDGPMRVTEADQGYKRSNWDEGDNNDEKDQTNDKDLSEKSQDVKKAKKKIPDKRKIIEKTEAMNRRLADWDDEDQGDSVALRQLLNASKVDNSRWTKFVIIRNLFTPESLAAELRQDPHAKTDLRDDIKEECEKFGAVIGMYIYDRDKQGVATAKFKTDAEAARCAKALDGREFDGRKIRAEVAQKHEKFEASRPPEEELEQMWEFADFIDVTT